MSRGIVGTLQLAASVVVAVPVAAFGLFSIAEGDPLLGVGFLALSVLVVVVEEAVTSPTDVPSMVLERVAGRVVETPDEE
ncbi:MAG: hypothetical protein V5A39_01115 [Haloarculaceae archaeon]